jgi:hypothetical protein
MELWASAPPPTSSNTLNAYANILISNASGSTTPTTRSSDPPLIPHPNPILLYPSGQVRGMIAITMGEKYNVLKKLMSADVSCNVIAQEEKKLSLVTGVYTDRYTTLSCGDVTLKYEEGLGKFSVLLRIAEFAVQITYFDPEYVAFIYPNYDEKWDLNDMKIIVKEKEFENIRFTFGILTAYRDYITLNDILKKMKEIERKFLEVLWPKQKLIYTAWVAHAMDKLGMLDELKEQKTA